MSNELQKLLRPIYRQVEQPLSRRAWLRAAGLGFGSIGLTAMMAEEARLFAATQDANPLAPKAPHFPAKAKRVIFLFMHGGPSQVDTFDYKPLLERDHGKPLPFEKPRIQFAQTGNADVALIAELGFPGVEPYRGMIMPYVAQPQEKITYEEPVRTRYLPTGNYNVLFIAVDDLKAN